jgi:hypothetical protein
MSPTTPSRKPAEGWENEGGSLRAPPAAEPAITTVLVETFKVGGYTYTNRPDAEAQARRMRNLGAAL